jgi:hypothetical protein
MNKYVEWFVDRERQRRGFLKMVARETPKQIMFVEAPTHMGKTWLIQRLHHECRVKGHPVAHFDFSGRQPFDYLSIVRHARDELGPAHFNPLTEVINRATSFNFHIDPGPAPAGGVDIRLAEGGQIRDSDVHIGDVAAGHIVKDNYFDVRVDSGEIRDRDRTQTLEAFFGCLTALSHGRVVVFLFDSYEDAKPKARQWVEGELLHRLRYGHLPRVVVVVAGKETPALDRAAWDHVLACTGLDLFTDRDVSDYLHKRGQAHLHLETVVLTSGRHPARLGEMVDSAAVSAVPADQDWL